MTYFRKAKAYFCHPKSCVSVHHCHVHRWRCQRSSSLFRWIWHPGIASLALVSQQLGFSWRKFATAGRLCLRAIVWNFTLNKLFLKHLSWNLCDWGCHSQTLCNAYTIIHNRCENEVIWTVWKIICVLKAMQLSDKLEVLHLQRIIHEHAHISWAWSSFNFLVTSSSHLELAGKICLPANTKLFSQQSWSAC